MRRRLLVENKPISSYKPYADICLVNNNTLDKIIVDGEEYSLDIYPKEQYTPIGVVVVPASHTDDGTARIISLVLMSTRHPNNGDSNDNTHLLCGGRGYDIPELGTHSDIVYISNDISNINGTQVLLGVADSITDAILPCDYFTKYNNPFDKYTYYMTENEDGNLNDKAAPSPYLNNGNKNLIYHSTENTGNCLADMDGKGNTEKILAVDNSYSTSWQTANTIQNIHDDEFIHPAAQCCWRYHTIGTQQGDWYLPSLGELGYLVARLKSINNSIVKIIEFKYDAIEIILPNTDKDMQKNTYYSSTYNISTFQSIYLIINDSAYLNYQTTINDGYWARAFCKI